MSGCDLQIKLDHPERVYTAGSTIKGLVLVRATRDYECRGLTVTQGWRTSGKGDTDRADFGGFRLFAGLWRAGEQASYPFELQAQRDPISYRGKLFQVEWRITAQADIPMELDLKAEEVFTLIPEPRDSTGKESELKVGQIGGDDTSGGNTGLSNPLVGPAVGVGVGIGAFLLAAYLVWGLFPAQVVDLSSRAALWRLIGAIAIGGIALNLLVNYVPRLLAALKVGPLDARVGSRTLRRGGSLKCVACFAPRADINLRQASLTIWAEEVATRKTVHSDGEDTTYVERVYRTEASFASDLQLPALQAVRLEGAVQIPLTAPVTFKGRWNGLIWKAVLRLDFPHWPDWEKEFSITVLP